MKTLFFLLMTCSLLARGGGKDLLEATYDCPGPWFTGPLLSSSSHVVPKGYFNFEPYVFYKVTTGHYNEDWRAISEPNFTRATLLPLFYLGLTDWMDILVAPRVSWQSSRGKSAFVTDDFGAHLGFQLLKDTNTNYLPAVKFYILEVFPTGEYQKGDSSSFETDISGLGSYQTTLGIDLGRTFEPWNCHFLSLRFNTFATFPTKVTVEGINAFGGAEDTKARVKIGQTYAGLFGLEYNFTQNWVLAFDAQALFQRATTYTGFPGRLPNGNLAPLGIGKSFQFSIAPAIEYNFSAALGLIGGVWFSLAGKNQPRFLSGVIALNYYGPINKGTKHQFRTKCGSGK